MELVNEAYRRKAELSGDPGRRARPALRDRHRGVADLPVRPAHRLRGLGVLEGGRVWEEPWPVADEALLARRRITLVVQVNGKLRDRIEVRRGRRRGRRCSRGTGQREGRDACRRPRGRQGDRRPRQARQPRRQVRRVTDRRPGRSQGMRHLFTAAAIAALAVLAAAPAAAFALDAPPRPRVIASDGAHERAARSAPTAGTAGGARSAPTRATR